MNLTLPAGLTFAAAPAQSVIAYTDPLSADKTAAPLTEAKPGYLSVDLYGYQRMLVGGDAGVGDNKGKVVSARDGKLSTVDIDMYHKAEEALLRDRQQLSATLNLGERHSSERRGSEVR